VENIVALHPAVAQCAVIGVPSEQWGEAVHAVIVPRPGSSVSADELIAFCHERIAGYKCPRTVEVRETPMPMSGAGKILKRELRLPFWEGKERRVN
jgi:long-chain acyl-CoA synthetase